jgi:chromosome segregation ATPase
MNKCSELKAALDAATLKIDATNAELVRVQRMAGITEENQRQEIAALTDRCVRLTNMNETESALRRKFEDRANRFDAADAELQRLRREVTPLCLVVHSVGVIMTLHNTSRPPN